MNRYFGILAAGKGTRMKSDKAKVLHEIAGKPLVNYVLDTTTAIDNQGVNLIIGHQADSVKEATKSYNPTYVLQEEQLGTGHAVMMLEPILAEKDGDLIILCGDVPFTSKETLQDLINHHESQQAKATVLTVILEDAGSYGRIVRDSNGNLEKIVEAKDGTADILAIKEINSGIYVFDIKLLFKTLNNINTNNVQKEYYLTDVIELLKNGGEKVSAFAITNQIEVTGINTIEDLAEMEKHYENQLVSQGER